MLSPMHHKKPKILRLRGRWVVADNVFRLPSGGIMFRPLGEGETISSAWAEAFPKKGWLHRLTSWMDKHEC